MIRPFVSTALGLICVAGLVGCQPPPKESDQNKVVTLAGPGFIQDWDTQLGMENGEKVEHVYLVGDIVHVMSNQSFDHAIKADTGDPVYANLVCQAPQEVIGGPVMIRDKGEEKTAWATSHTIQVYNHGGQLLQSIELGASVTGPPMAYKGIIYVGVGGNGGLLDFIDIDAKVLFVANQIMCNGPVRGAAGAIGGYIYCGSEDGSVRAFDTYREPVWPLLNEDRFQTSGKIFGDVATDKEMRAGKSGVYFASTDGQLYCVDPVTGRLKWKYYSGSELLAGPRVTDTLVFQYVPGTGLVAIPKNQSMKLDTPDNAVIEETPIHSALWTCKHGRDLLSIDKKYAYILSDSNKVLAVNLQTGEVEFTSKRSDLVAYANNMTDSIIYASTKSGHVIAIHPEGEPGATGVLVLNEKPNEKPLTSPAMSATN